MAEIISVKNHSTSGDEDVHTHRTILNQLFAQAKKEIVIVSPFIKKEAVEELIEVRAGKPPVTINIATVIDVKTLLDGGSDIVALISLLKWGIESKNTVSLFCYNHQLHAKLYVVDKSHAVLTSANWTRPGLADNVEYGILIHAGMDGFDTLVNDAYYYASTANYRQKAYTIRMLETLETEINELKSLKSEIENDETYLRLQKRLENMTSQLGMRPPYLQSITQMVVNTNHDFFKQSSAPKFLTAVYDRLKGLGARIDPEWDGKRLVSLHVVWPRVFGSQAALLFSDFDKTGKKPKQKSNYLVIPKLKAEKRDAAVKSIWLANPPPCTDKFYIERTCGDGITLHFDDGEFDKYWDDINDKLTEMSSIR